MTSRSNKPRKKIPPPIEAQILTACRRRCCLCYHLQRKSDENLHGQIAHIDQDRTNHKPENLAYLCLPHHDSYDSKTSQSKGLTVAELVHAKEELLRFLQTDANSGVGIVSLTLTFDRRLSAHTDEEREHLISSLLPPLVQAIKAPAPPTPDGKTRYTVELGAETAEQICKSFNERLLPDGIVDVRLTRLQSERLVFSEQFVEDRNGVSKRQAIECVKSHDQAILFAGNKVIKSGPSTCGIFTKRYLEHGQHFTVIVVTATTENVKLTIFAALQAMHETVGNLDGVNPLKCLEAFLSAYGVAIALPGSRPVPYLLGETLRVPGSVFTREQVFDWIRQFVNSGPDEKVGVIGSIGYRFDQGVHVHLFFSFARERYLRDIRRK